jgi:hypothetical protein
MKSTTIILITITLLWATNAFSAGPPVQYQFKGGDPASASQVNHNFQELADRIQELKDQRPNIDYHSYLTPENITTKIYSTSHIIVGTDPALCIETELTQKIERTTQGTDTLITETNTVLGSDPGQICSFYSYQYLATANALLRKKRMFYDSTRTTVVYEVIFNDDASVLVNPMTVGKTRA